jgi:hypothetical protein
MNKFDVPRHETIRRWITPNWLIALGTLSVLLSFAPKAAYVYLQQGRNLPLYVFLFDPFVIGGAYLGWYVSKAAVNLSISTKGSSISNIAREKIVMSIGLGILGMLVNVISFMTFLCFVLYDTIVPVQ